MNQEYMLQQRLVLAIIGVLAAALALLPNLVKSQAQTQISDPPPLPQPSTPVTPVQIPNLSPTERLDEWAKNSPKEPLPASISFGGRVPDMQVVQLMRRYNVKPRAVFMSVAGMSGTHRNGKGDEAAIVIAEARQKTAEMMQKDLEGSHRRFQDFEKNHPREEVLEPSAEKTHLAGARSLLRSVEESEVALVKAKGGQPLIVGVEVIGSIDDVKKLAADPSVKGFEPGFKFNGRVIVPTPQTQADQVNSSLDITERVQTIQNLKAGDVYTRVENRARNGNKGGNQ